MKELIKKIHQSDIYGIFIETGCGLPVSSALFSVSGASSTVFMAESPYSSEYLASTYNLGSEPKKYRSVSAENLHYIINSPRLNKFLEEKKINLIYTASFQVGEFNDKSTHGWIALKVVIPGSNTGEYSLKYYHISIHEPLSREEYIRRIGENGLKLILAGNKKIPGDCEVDIVLNEDFSPDYECTLSFIAALETKEQFSIFSQDRIDRLESITRDNQSLILFKGSFNPIQSAHLNIIKQAEKKFPETSAFFMISINAVQKGKQSEKSLMSRIKLIFQLGYQVVICNNPFFKNNINFLRQKFGIDKPVILAMGLDTFNRLLIDYNQVSEQENRGQMLSDFNNVKFFCMNRSGKNLHSDLLNSLKDIFYFERSNLEELSSTKLRELLAEKNLEEIKKIVPPQVYDLLIKEEWL